MDTNTSPVQTVADALGVRWPSVQYAQKQLRSAPDQARELRRLAAWLAPEPTEACFAETRALLLQLV